MARAVTRSTTARALATAPVLAFVVAVGGTVLTAGQAVADPATGTSYAAGAAPARFTGLAFDTCAAPSAAAMKAWTSSPYRAVGVYVSGSSRTCAQANLTKSWVRTISGYGWQLVPIHKGLQPPCGARERDPKIDPEAATDQGEAAAGEAVAAMSSLGLLPGSAVYLDIENYVNGHASCRSAVLRFTSGWTRELHRRGYVAGVYANLASGARHLAETFNSTSYARPDAIWVARWDSSAKLTGLAGVPDAYWSEHQRAKQYRGDHDETLAGSS
jgi:hypothetical protein